MPSRSLGHRAPLLWLVLPFIAGLVLAKVTGSRLILIPLLLALGTGCIGLWTARRSLGAWAPAIGLTMLLAGLASHPLRRVRLDVWDALPPREAQLVVRVRAERIFPNCPRYIHPTAAGELSPYAPREGHVPPEPKWKSMDFVADVLPGPVGRHRG